MKKPKFNIWITSLILLGVLACGNALAAKTFDTSFNIDNFSSNPTPIDNSYLPLPVGYTFHYAADGEDECEVNTVFVSGKSKTVLGLDMVVVEDLEYLDEDCDGEELLLTEETDDWYVQDDFGNVWYFGEWTTAYEYDPEECETAPEVPCASNDGSWEAGIEGALPGIIMLDRSIMQPGLTYEQEYWEEEAEDMAKILRLNTYIETESFGDFEDCLKTKEWTPLEVGHVEHKYYCENIGLVLIEELKEKTVIVELVDISTD